MAWSQAGSGAPKVGICVATKGTVSIDWAFSFAHLVRSVGVECELLAEGHFELDYARNDLVDMARQARCTHVFFLDSDLIPFELNPGAKAQPCSWVVPWLLSLEYPIVSGLYWLKKGASNLAAFPEGDAFATHNLRGELKDLVGRHIYVDGVGIGCCMIDMRVFEKVSYPWFSYYRGKERGPDGRWPEISEDYYFFRKAKAAGFPVLALCSLVSLHEGKVYHAWGGDANVIMRF